MPSWEGSDDHGSDHVRSLAAMELDCWDLPPPPATLHWPQAGAAGAPALRVSLLARLPETAVRAVAQAAGLPNWDWIAPGCATMPYGHSASLPLCNHHYVAQCI